MNCDQIEKMLTGFLLGELDDRAGASVRAHVTDCARCRSAVRACEPTLAALREALAARSQPVLVLSPEARTRVFRSGRLRSRIPVRRIVE